MRSLGRHPTLQVPPSNIISSISKKVISSDLDSKLSRMEHEKEVSIRESSEAGQGYQPVITEKMKNMTTDEIFERLVKENIDFRDYRYNELMKEFESEMEDFKRTAPTFEELSDAQSMQINQMNPNQMYAQFQTKFYALRKRDKDDLQERYERVTRIVRSSHVQEVQNLVSKFKGVLRETIEKKLEEQKLKYELEHKEMRDNHFQMKSQIRTLEEKCEFLQEKINEKEKKLQEMYDKIIKMNNENSYRNQDQEKLQKMMKEKEAQIEKLQKSEKALEALQQQKIDYALLIKDKENTINQKDQLIQKLQKQLQQQTSKMQDQDQKIKTLEQQESLKVQSRTTIKSEDEQSDVVNLRRTTPDQNYNACRSALTRNDSRNGAQSSNNKLRNIKQPQQMQAVPIQTFGDVFRKFKQAKREESIQNKQFIDQLQQKIKLKEDQIKLLTNEVMSLREESDTYLQNLQSMQQQNSQMNSKTQGYLTQNPNINDLILDPYKRGDSSMNKSRLSMTEENRYLQSALSKTSNQFNSAVSPKLVQLQQASSRNRNLSNNLEQNKENIQKLSLMNTTDLSIYKAKTPQSVNNTKQSLINITNKATTPDPSKKFQEIQVNRISSNNNNDMQTPYNQNKNKITQVSTIFQNTNLQTNNSTQYFSQTNNNNITNSSQQLLKQDINPQIGNKSIHISNFNNNSVNYINSINNQIQSPQLLNQNVQVQKQKKILGSYRIQPTFNQKSNLTNNYISSASDSFIPLNI
ncbi:hypothetical protein TTHERM_00463660 (macronuclear) [Tetrahymena thermophila SB210]|uniref:Uncharacterized protein n=1 Tax=Tetrahymena thermophila (strain SB210) TaxID=312017 RepID=Q23PR7_TETTS|nr:hypothetical protein TTHERM_00463660 [Tetrahymena thermophila SB210]EAR98618.1 hypothetical protein TTHERM_00463660 [Tetrahymena thermophila SB210]|eukprot:XP_001018863.1 hypothetical protein TTHERM_00463660 [Tetrahymena thermophila SB210]